MSRLPSLFRPQFVLLLFCCVLSLPAQRTIHVPAEQSTIQAAIDAADSGDTVLIAPGDYHESIDFKGKAITVTATSGQGGAAIVGNGKAPSVSFISGEGRNSILRNLTVEGGGAPGGMEQAGVYIHGASPTLTGDQIYGGECHGIHVVQGAPLVDHSSVVSTVGDNANTACTVANGTAIFIEGQSSGSQAIVQNSTLQANYTGVSVPNAESGGAGIFARNGASVLIQKNTFSENGAGASDAKGGAILIEHASALIINNLIYDNFAGSAGGGIAILNSGSASSPIQVINNTVAGNRALASADFLSVPYAGAEIDIEGSGAVNLSNNIFWGYTTGAAVTCNGASSPPPASTSFNNNDVYNQLGPTVAGVGLGTCSFDPGQNGNITADPLFASAGFFQFRLTAQSPAVDAGNNGALYATATGGADTLTDLDGNPRVVNGQSYSSLAIVDMGAYEFRSTTSPVTLTLTSSVNPSALGQAITFSAAVTLQSGPAAGAITLQDGATPLATVPLTGGTAQFTTAALTAGTHQITAVYNPGGASAGATASLTQVVDGRPTTTSLSVTPTAGPAFSPLLFAGKVTSSSGTPTGSMTFRAGGQVLGVAALQPDGTAQTSIASLGAGPYSITATYSGDATFQPCTSAPVQVVLSQISSTVNLTAGPNPAYVGQNVTLRAVVPAAQGSAIPSGSITFSAAGLTLGSVPLDASGTAVYSTSGLSAGTNPIVAAYSGDSNYLPGSALTQEIVRLNPTTISLTSNPNPSFLGQTVTLTAFISNAGQPVDGQVTFFDGQSVLTTAHTAGGKALATTAALAPGQHALSAAFQGDAAYAGSTSPPLTQTVLAAGFTIQLSPGSVSLRTGKTASTTIQLTSLGAFAGPLRLSFGQLPSHSTGILGASSVALAAGGQGSTSFSLSTVDLTSALRTPNGPRRTDRTLVLAALCLPFLLWKRRRTGRVLLSAMLAVMLVTLSGCTDIGFPMATASPGVYSIPITATDSNNVAQTAILQVHVTE